MYGGSIDLPRNPATIGNDKDRRQRLLRDEEREQKRRKELRSQQEAAKEGGLKGI
ncbi:MAG: hypothetical protein HDS03_05415 [Bacteroides sp.]|nr:hypothetical protein [Bacteroides sp.]